MEKIKATLTHPWFESQRMLSQSPNRVPVWDVGRRVGTGIRTCSILQAAFSHAAFHQHHLSVPLNIPQPVLMPD